MHEHAEPQVHKPLLQIEKRPPTAWRHALRFALCGPDAALAAQHSGSRRLGGHSEKVSPCRHLRHYLWAVMGCIDE
jgi:hypothetical protein